MEELSVAIIGEHLRMHYGSLSVFYKKESKGFKEAMKVIEQRNEQKLKLSTFQTILFLEEDFEEGKLGVKINKANGKAAKPVKPPKPIIKEPPKEEIIKTIEEEKVKVDKEDRGVLELTKAIIKTEPEDEECPEELLHKEIEELTKPVEKESFLGKMFGKIKSFATK
jgi:hypothetical protein